VSGGPLCGLMGCGYKVGLNKLVLVAYIYGVVHNANMYCLYNHSHQVLDT
jgi:hypothetical protein